MNSYFQTPPVVKNLIIINALVYMATALIQPAHNAIMEYCALWLGAPLFHTYQFVTYMFVHANFEHIFFNMFALWMFGRTLEYELGSKRFLTYYMVCGIGAALIQYFTALAFGELPMSLVGASGAVMGLLLAFGVMHPNAVIMLLIPADPDEGQMVRHHLRRHRTFPRLARRRQCGAFRPRGRYALGFPAAPLVEAARHNPLLSRCPANSIRTITAAGAGRNRTAACSCGCSTW